MSFYMTKQNQNVEKELDTDRDFETKFDISNYAFHRPIPR